MVVSGTGTAGDPFVLSADIGFAVTSNAQFALTLTGAGTVANPWRLSVNYAPTATLAALPDVADTVPTNGQVLTWTQGTGLWSPAAPTVAPAGAVQHDATLTGDGSIDLPLGVVADDGRFITVTSNGVAMTDDGINSLVRHFPDAATRDLATPPPTANTLSILDVNPGQVEYFDGSVWLPLPGSFDTVASTEFLNLSGPYVAQRLTHYMSPVSAVTDASGIFDVVSIAALAGRSGVLSVQFQETGSLSWKAVLFANTNRVSATAYRLVDGTPYAGQAVTGLADAWLY